MDTAALARVARALERGVIALAVAALLYRATVYHLIPRPAGAPWGLADVIDFALGVVLFLLGGICAGVGIALSNRAREPAERGAAHRPVVTGMTAFVVYYLVHPYVPALL